MKVFMKSLKSVLLAGLVVAATGANAAVDTAATIAGIGDAGTAVVAVGVAVIAVHVGIKLYKWITRAL